MMTFWVISLIVSLVLIILSNIVKDVDLLFVMLIIPILIFFLCGICLTVDTTYEKLDTPVEKISSGFIAVISDSRKRVITVYKFVTDNDVNDLVVVKTVKRSPFYLSKTKYNIVNKNKLEEL